MAELARPVECDDGIYRLCNDLALTLRSMGIARSYFDATIASNPFIHPMIRGPADNTSLTNVATDGRRNGETVPASESPLLDFRVRRRADVYSDRAARRKNPRVSAVVVLTESNVVSSEGLLSGIRSRVGEDADVVVACAGYLANLRTLQRCVRDALFLIAPEGTSSEDLREMAMAQARGDIVTLMSDALLAEIEPKDRPRFFATS